MVAWIVLAEAVLIGVWGFPDYPEGINGFFFSCCVVLLFLSYSFTFVIASRAPYLTHIWSASKVTYGKVRSAGNKAWAFVLGLGRKV